MLMKHLLLSKSLVQGPIDPFPLPLPHALVHQSLTKRERKKCVPLDGIESFTQKEIKRTRRSAQLS
uniref:Uncharacterized protein n=1 Tax=Daphnia magna TaxID=35525 RepID=A0A0P6C6F0_9CRUS